jgi:hypothetical protein
MEDKLIQNIDQISTELQLLKSKDIRDVKDALRILSGKIDRLTSQDEQSESIDQLTTALAKAKLEANPLVCSGEIANRGEYSDMTDYLEAYQEALCKNGLVITFTPQVGKDNLLVLVTKLSHSSGQWMKSMLPAEPSLDDPKIKQEQAYGARLTYMKRYAYAAMMGR